MPPQSLPSFLWRRAVRLAAFFEAGLTPVGSGSDSVLLWPSRRKHASRCRLRLRSSLASAGSLAVCKIGPSRPEAGPADSLWSTVGLQFAAVGAIT